MHLKHSKGKEHGYVNSMFRNTDTENNPNSKARMIGSAQMKIAKHERKTQCTK